MNTAFRKIMLVDDSPRDCELIKAALEEYNLLSNIVELADGEEALDYLYKRGRFESRPIGLPVVILLDLKMPKVNGLEFLRAIKSDPALKLIPVVVMTSSREEQDIMTSYQLGANAYVVKPMDFGGFAEAAKQVGIFWAQVNEPPLSISSDESNPSGGALEEGAL